VSDLLAGDLTLWPLVERRAERTPDALFAVDERGRTLTFAQYRDAALRAAAGLHALGIGGGTPVSWQLPTRLEALVLVAALARLGARQNPILPFLRDREVGFIVRQIAARLLIVPTSFRGFDHAAMARELARDVAGLEIVLAEGSLPDGDPAALPPFDATPDVRWIFYSSGTTADPKGVRHTDRSVGLPGRAIVERFALVPEDRNALVFPLTHIGGIAWLFAGLLSGCAHILVEAFDPKTTAPVLAHHGATVLGAGTVFHQAYLAYQRERGGASIFPRARLFPGGGAPKPPGLHAEIKRTFGGFGVCAGYGLTEYPIVSQSAVGDPDDKLAACEGRATRDTEIRIVDGEIRVRGPHLFRGYVDAGLDADAFDAQGFLRTGDLGHVDAEGFVTVTGRLKDVIIRKGENLSAKEIEDHLSAHPAIRDVAVVGLPDAERGERACAVVVADGAPPSLADLAAFLRGRGLAAMKIPEQLELVAELPRNASGKVLKRALQARFGARTS
jgi:acyl-CoA synthetase (AMP-forming)/AMP-acid ligase II